MQEHNVVGASLGVIEGGNLVRVIHLGLESSVTKTPVSDRSIFMVGSISKSVSAWTAMTLVRDGKIGLDEPINTHLTRWKIPASSFDAEGVTLRRLLSHTAGVRLGGYGGFTEEQTLPSLEQSLAGQTNGAGGVELFQPPGASFSYSGGGYTLIQLLIEEISGMSFHEYAQHAVLQPLAMNESSYQPSGDLLQRRIQPHGVSMRPIAQYEFRAQAAASLHTTVGDLSNFVLANVKANPVLGNEAVLSMRRSVADAGFAGVGLGFFISAGGQLVGHAGSNFGWRAEMQFDPKTKEGLVVMTNSEAADEFLTDIKCQWDAQRDQPALSDLCRTRESNADLAQTISSILAAILLLSLGVLIWALVTSRVQFALPQTFAKRSGLVLLVMVTLFALIFMYTPLGVYFIAGFRSITATIHYAPPLIAGVVPWIIGLLLMLCCAFMVQRSPRP